MKKQRKKTKKEKEKKKKKRERERERERNVPPSLFQPPVPAPLSFLLFPLTAMCLLKPGHIGRIL